MSLFLVRSLNSQCTHPPILTSLQPPPFAGTDLPCSLPHATLYVAIGLVIVGDAPQYLP
jgi:hypothetical protein